MDGVNLKLDQQNKENKLCSLNGNLIPFQCYPSLEEIMD